jgi:outer membrane receptor protein involved in Fe transport
MKFRDTVIRTAALATLATGLGGGTAFAQDADTAEAQEERNEVIIVTARKREEALKDVPISVSAFGETRIEDLQIQNTTDLAAYTPGFAFSEAFGRDGDRPVIRGTSNILVSDGKVGIFVDGAPILGDSTGIDLDSFQRVEIIKGPQAAVYGRGTLSGALNYVSRAPSEETQGKIEGTLGNWGRADLFARLEGPLPVFGDAIKYFISYKSYNFDGDYNNQLDLANRLGAQKSESWNGALFLQPSDNIDISLRYIDAQDNDGHFAVRLQPGSANNCFLTTRPTFCGVVSLPEAMAINVGDIRQPGLERQTQRFIMTADVDDILGTGMSLHYQATAAEQSEIAGYDQSYDGRTFHLSAGFAACTVPVANRRCGFSPFNDTSGYTEFSRTQEIRLESPADQPLRWRVGYFNLDRTRKSNLGLVELYSSGPDSAFTRSTTNTWAVFGGLDWDVTDALTLGFEVRQNNDEITDLPLAARLGDYIAVAPPGTLSFNPNATFGTIGPKRTQVFEKTLPRVTAAWKLSEDVSLFGQYAVGNAPGGFNQAGAPQPIFDEEQLTNYEVGIKTSVAGFNYLNLTGFFMQYEDQVLTTTFTSATAVQSFNFNIGEQDIKGIEFEAQRELFDGFTLTSTFSYVDGEFTAGTDPQQALFSAGAYCTLGTQSGGTGTNATVNRTTPAVTVGGVPANTSCAVLGSIVGNQSPLVPPMQASLAARYERAVSDNLNFFIASDVTYRDSFYAQVDNLQETGSSVKVNAQLGFETDKLKVTVWGRNLTNEDTPEGILRYVDFLQQLPAGLPGAPGFQGTPRAFAISAPRKPAGGITVAYNW